MLNEKEAFLSSINGISAFIEQHTQNCHCFDENELEKKIYEIETLNANLDAKFLTLQNVSKLKESKVYDLLDFYRRLADTRSKVKLTLGELKDRNDLIKFLNIEIKSETKGKVEWIEKVRLELLKIDLLSTREKVILWCCALVRIKTTILEAGEFLDLIEILDKEIFLVKNRFLNKSERLQNYEPEALSLLQNNVNDRNLDALQHLFGVSQRSFRNRRPS